MDLEMTGLDAETCLIVEAATVITDSKLEVIAEGPNEVIHLEEDVLQAHLDKGEFFREHPSNINLHEAIRKSTVSHEELESKTLNFISEHVVEKTSPLCGNSIHKDREFLQVHMSSVTDYLHYRNLDVSTIKGLAQRWRPDIFETASAIKTDDHRAKGDILASIEELRYYRDNFFKL